MYIYYYHILITVKISNNYLTCDFKNYLHYIRMQEYRLSDIYYVRGEIYILFFTHKPLAEHTLMAHRLAPGPGQ